MPLLARRRVLAAKIESVLGDAETLAAADAAMNVFDAKMTPDIPYDAREGQGGFSPLTGVPGAAGGSCTFSVELHGTASPSDPDPLWAKTLLPACGLVNTTGHVYRPVSRAPAVAGLLPRTVTLGLYEDGLCKVLRGCMGNAVFRFAAGKIVRVEFSFKGIWVTAVDTAILAPTYPTVIPPRFTSAGLTLGDWTPVLSEMTLDLGNEVVLREDVNDSAGYTYAIVTGRAVKGTMNPEATLVSANDLAGLWLSQTEQALAFQVGTGSGETISFAAPKVQFAGAAEGDRGKTAIEDIEFRLNRSASAGDDELAITFA